MKLINLTPHAVTVQGPAGSITVEPSGTVARVATEEQDAGTVNGVPVVTRQFGEVQGIPSDTELDAQGYDGALVSALVLSALEGQGRARVFAPDTGPSAVRNEDGQIVAVTRLVAPQS